MDRKKSPNISPARLIIGSNQKELFEYAIKFCKKVFCENDCNSCITCKQIGQNKFHNILWLTNEKQYKLQDIDIIFKKASLTLNEFENFFFVIENADQLNLACSNKLLKIIEEPPTGYNFIFLTQRPQDILDTIKSRCIKIELKQSCNEQFEPLINYFTTVKIEAPDFLFFIDKMDISEHKTTKILDEILKYWIKKNNIQKIDLLLEAMQNLPGPGGSNLFWKNLFTKFNQSIKL